MSLYRRGGTAVIVGASFAVVVGTVAVVAWRGVSISHAALTLPVHGHVQDFSLVDHQARPISRATLAGSVWIADFIFTRCAGQCPLMSAQMAKLQQTFENVPGLRFVSFSVDPTYDTPARLAAYATAYGAAPEQWQFVTEAGTPPGEAGGMTGPITTVHALAQQSFHLGVSQEGTAEEPITHSVRLVLIDRRGSIRGYYDATEPRAMAALHDDARRLVRQR